MRKERNISLKTTKKGTKILQVKINVPNEKPIYKNIKVSDYPTEKIAMDVACKIRDSMNIDKELARQKQLDSKRHVPTVQECFDQTGCGLAITTKSRHQILFNQSAKEYADYPITKVTGSMVMENVSKFANTHTTKYTSRVVSVWSNIFEYAIDEGFDVKNHARKCKNMKGRKVAVHRKVYISPSDLKKFMSVLCETKKGRDVAEFLVLLNYTGLQPSEAFALTYDDISDECIFINKMIGSNTVKRYQTVPPKTSNRERFIPVHNDIKPLVEKLKMNAKTRSSKLLFESNGEPWKIEKVSGLINRASKRSGIDFHAYMLRHKVATNLAEKGTDIRTVGELLGHVPQNTTVGYIVTNEQKKINAIRKLN